MELNNYQKAQVFLKKSLQLKPSKRETAFIETKIAECKRIPGTD
jgi:hypothetical protein